MDKEYLEKTIKDVEESIKVSEDNLKKAQNHIEEGVLILAALKTELDKLQ
jgi:hypothetical protein